jgi:hypothetical protein
MAFMSSASGTRSSATRTNSSTSLGTPRNEDREKKWGAFQADPEWIKVRTASEQAGKILIKDGIKSVYLTPTDFSPLK